MQCSICNESKVTKFVELDNVTTKQHCYFDTAIQAKNAATSQVEFFYCNNCRYLFNAKFNNVSLTYDSSYRLNQMYSNLYQDYVETVISKVLRRTNLDYNCQILEIGCNEGKFLEVIAERTAPKKIIAFEPRAITSKEKKDYIIPTKFSLDRVDEYSFDLIIMRFVFEQLLDPLTLLTELKTILSKDGSIMIETINCDRLLDTLDIAKTGYEGHQYHSITSMSRLCNLSGLRVIYAEPTMDGDNLLLLIQHAPKILSNFKPFSKLSKTIIKDTKNVIWGVSGRAVTLLNILNWGEEVINYAVDIDPKKHGKFLPVTGQKILTPQQMNEFSPDIIIVSNSYYLDEIKELVTCDCKFINTLGEYI